MEYVVKDGTRYLDLKGKRFGALVVLEEAERRDGYVWWRCRCDCGAIEVRRSSALMNGLSHGQFAGCRECQRKRRRASFRYDVKAYRAQWRDTGSLWGLGQEEALEREIYEAVGEECGGWSIDVPSRPEALSWDPPKRERGREDTGMMTLVEIAKVFGVSRERARQLEAQALRKLRRLLAPLYEERVLSGSERALQARSREEAKRARHGLPLRRRPATSVQEQLYRRAQALHMKSGIDYYVCVRLCLADFSADKYRDDA